MRLPASGAVSTPTCIATARNEPVESRSVARSREYTRLGRIACRLLFAATLFCSGLQAGTLAAQPVLREPEVTYLIRTAEPGVKDPGGWAEDILKSLAALRLDGSVENVCAVIAVVDQESGFAENPVVPNLGATAEQAAREKIARNPMFRAVFLLFPQLEQELMERIRASRTERDLDLAYRRAVDSILRLGRIDFLIAVDEIGSTVADVFEYFNDVSTIGSMQVSVRSALAAERQFRGGDLTLEQVYTVRDFLYTRSGGLYAGIRQLLGYRTGYSRKIHRFADYNAGRYSSRNAAFQKIVAVLSGEKLALDGDLLIYRKSGSVSGRRSATENAIRQIASGFALPISEREIRADLLLEKKYAFVETTTFNAIRELYRDRTEADPPFAVIPDIQLRGVKISRPLTTEWYARRLDHKYRECLSRSRG